jgi:hypothetical protein
MRKFWLLLCASLLLTACGAGTGTDSGGKNTGSTSSQKLELKAGGKNSVLDVKSGVIQTTSQDSSDPSYKAAVYGFTLANYDLKQSSELAKTLSKPEETRVYFKLFGDPGSDMNTPIKVGTYRADVKEFPKYNPTSLAIIGYADGKQTVAMSQDSPAIETKGEVKITSVEGDTVNGEINITTGSSMAAKGNFTAKIKPLGF